MEDKPMRYAGVGLGSYFWGLVGFTIARSDRDLMGYK